MTLKDYLIAQCAKHNLTSVSVGIQYYSHTDEPGFCAYAHWQNADGRCASGDSDTPEQAIARAIANAHDIRADDVPDALEMEDAA